jgi:hypothetical protein
MYKNPIKIFKNFILGCAAWRRIISHALYAA